MAAALIYQHASREADRSIADHMDVALGLDGESEDDGDGSDEVRVPTG